MKNVLASAMEAEIGAQFTDYQNGEYLRTIFMEIGHPQTATPVSTESSEAILLNNIKSEHILLQSIDMRFYWVRHHIKKDHFRIFWTP